MEDEKLKRLEGFISHLPEAEQNRSIIILEGKLLNWKKVLEELKKGGEFADKIEKKLEEKLK